MLFMSENPWTRLDITFSACCNRQSTHERGTVPVAGWLLLLLLLLLLQLSFEEARCWGWP